MGRGSKAKERAGGDYGDEKEQTIKIWAMKS